jgi:hypothetical protein
VGDGEEEKLIANEDKLDEMDITDDEDGDESPKKKRK